MTFKLLFGVEAFPHGDTINDTFKRINPEDIQESICQMSAKLIRSKVLYPYRVKNKYFVIAIDGTGTITYRQRHCPYCLTRTSNGKTIYYHPVLEAKLVTSNGFAFSIMTEFIENEGAQQTKQDCELKAFYRLSKRLKTRFPRLPILLSLDGLYAGGPTFAICQDNAWKFMIVLKDKDLKTVNEEFTALAKLQRQNSLTIGTEKEGPVKQEYQWVTDISYEDSQRREHTLTVLQCLETKITKNGERSTTKFQWITNLTITAASVVAVATDAGRNRWKVENEGFNVQKNGGYELEHAYSNDHNAAKIFYLFLQIAHILAQLINKGSLIKKLIKNPFGSNKNFALRLLEAWRNARLTRKDLDNTAHGKIQIRFDTS